MEPEYVEAKAFLDGLLGGKLTLGSAVQAIRLCDEVSLTDFAAMLGVSQSLLKDVEMGREALPAAEAARWAKVLGYHEEHFARLSSEPLAS